MSGYDSRPETLAHIRRVQDFMHRALANLGQRAERHDASKLVEPELAAFDLATPKLASLEYGSEEYRASLRDLGPALAHHFEVNDHHPEHYERLGVRGMSLMALLEMLCDWRAASERVAQRTDDLKKLKSFEDGLVYNQERFGYSDELAEILRNTARELGDVTSTFDGGDDFVAPALDMDDMRGYLMTLMAQGWPEGLLIKQAIVSIRALHAAADRWRKLEYGYSSSAPLWLDQRERDKLLTMLRGQKSTEARLLRQALQDMFPKAA